MKGRDAESYEDTGYGEGSRYAAHLDRGWSLLERGDLEPARTAAEHASQTRPEDPDAAMLLGAIALAEGNATESLRAYERAVELDPDYLEAYAAAAQVCLLDLDEPSRGLAYCEDALELEGLGPFEAIDLHLLAADCELSATRLDAARQRLASMPERNALFAALSVLGEPDDADDDELEIDLGTDRGVALAFLRTDFEGEPLDDDERTDRVGRVLALGLRLARLQIDAGDIPAGYELARVLVARFDEEPDAWHLLSETAHRAGDPSRAAAAGLRTLTLDRERGVAAWVPTPAIVQRRALRALARSGDDEVAAIAKQDPPVPIVVKDAPSPELVLEGVDPRIPALCLATRGPEDTSPRLSGIAVYRANIGRYAGDAERFESELRWSLLDEVTAFLGTSDERREALGLPPLPAALRPVEPPVPEEDPAATRRKPRRRAKASSTSTGTKAKKKSKAKAKPKT